MIYFIIRDTLIMTYLFSYLQKQLNKMNGQTWYLKVKCVMYFGTDGVDVFDFQRQAMLNDICKCTPSVLE
jgi:hypothetical protein